MPSAGIEYYLPLFFDETATLFHYLPERAQLVFTGDLDAAIKRFTADTKQRHAFLSHDRERPILEPQRLFLSDDDFYLLAKPFARIVLPAQPSGGWAAPLPNLALERHADAPLAAFAAYLETTKNRVLFTVESAGRRETIAQLFAEHHLRPAGSDSFAAWLASDERFALGVAPSRTASRCRARVTRSSPRPSCTARSAAARGAAARNRRATSTRWCAICPS